MLHSPSSNNVWLIYNDKQSCYEELLIKAGTVSKHHRNIQMLTTEMFKVKNEMSPEIICDIFSLNWDMLIILKHLL